MMTNEVGSRSIQWGACKWDLPHSFCSPKIWVEGDIPKKHKTLAILPGGTLKLDYFKNWGAQTQKKTTCPLKIEKAEKGFKKLERAASLKRPWQPFANQSLFWLNKERLKKEPGRKKSDV